MGPSLYLIPRLFEETFSDLGTSLDAEGIKLVKCEPNYRIVFPDKEVVEMSSDLTKMKTEVEKWEGEKGFEGCVPFPLDPRREHSGDGGEGDSLSLCRSPPSPLLSLAAPLPRS